MLRLCYPACSYNVSRLAYVSDRVVSEASVSYDDENCRRRSTLEIAISTSVAQRIIYSTDVYFVLFQLWYGSEWREAEKRDAGDNEYAQSMAERAQKEPVPNQGREDHAGHHYQDDPDPGVDVVRKRAETPEEGEQDDMGTQKQGRGRGQ